MIKKFIEILAILVFLVVSLFFAGSKLGAFYYNQGNDYYERALYKEAIESYVNSIRFNPNAWEAHLGLADSYRESNNFDQAIPEYKNTLKIYPTCARAYQALSHMYIKRGRPEDALAILKEADQKNINGNEINESLDSACSSYIAGALEKSKILFFSQEQTKAISILEDTLKLCPGVPLAHYTLAIYFISGKNYERAESELNKSIKLDPSFSLAYKLLAYIAFEKGDFEGAVSYGETALKFNDSDASTYNDLGIALMNLERYTEAAGYLRKAVYLNPSNTEYIYSLASVYRDNKNFDGALVEYDKLNALKPDYPNLHNDLADIYRSLGREGKAKEEYQKELNVSQQKLKSNPDDYIVLNSYAYALCGIGETDKAKSVIVKVIDSQPNYRQAHLTLAKIYERSNNLNEALKALERARQMPGDYNFINEQISRLKAVYSNGKPVN